MNGMFGTKHLILLGISVVVVLLAAFGARKMKDSTVCKLLFYVGILSEITKIFYYISANEATHGGVLPKTDLPFHLCSIQILLIATVNLVPNGKIRRFVLSFMLPSCLFGGIAALLIPTQSSLNGSWVITTQYFGYHAAIITFSLKMMCSKEFSPNIKDYFSCLKFLLLIMFFAFYINSILYDGSSNINYMYVVSPPQSGLPYLNEEQGWLVYILRYAALVVGCVTLFYLKPIIVGIQTALKERKQRQIQGVK